MGSVWVEPYQTRREEMFRIRIENDDGSRYCHHETFFSKRRANDKAREISDILSEGRKLRERKQFGLRFTEYLKWLDDRIRAGDKRMKKSTKRIITSSFDDILSRFKETFLDELKNPDLNKFKNDLLRDHNVGGVNRILVDLRTFLNWCVNTGDIPKSPMKGIKLFDTEFQGYFFNRKEMVTVFRRASRRLWRATYVLKETGMRVGELVGIDWPDLQEHSVTVTGKGGRRTVPLPPIVRYNLTKLLDKRWSLSGIEQAWHRMILKTGIINPNSIDRKTGRSLAPTLHDLRHTFASTYLAKGNSLPNLMEIGGWKTLKAVEIYIHPDLPNLLKTMQKRVK